LIKEILSNQEKIDISINKLKELAHNLHRVPMVKEFEKIQNLHNGYGRRDLEKHLNLSYNEICKKYLPQYNLNCRTNISKSEIIESIHKMYNEFGHILSYNDYSKLDYSYDFNQMNNLLNKTYVQLVKSLGYTPLGISNKPKSDEQNKS
jgi:hypothetical protein